MFDIKVYVREGAKFFCRQPAHWKELDCLPDENVLVQNYVDKDNQSMHGAMPWRGAREKHSEFLQNLIEYLTDENDVVFDWSASTGNNHLHMVFLVFF